MSFIPLINEKWELYAELDILFLRPGIPRITNHEGDLDNRIKTLWDALSVPNNNQLPTNSKVDKAFYCLLQDDALIGKINITPDRLLAEPPEKSYVELVINVKIKTHQTTMMNLSLIS